MALNEDAAALGELLACPWCMGELTGFENASLSCSAMWTRLHDTIRRPGPRIEAEQQAASGLISRIHYGLLGNPRVYDFQQAHFGAKPVIDVLLRRN